ncbi:hypothetical protein PM082_022168 [Marasmius tenuissimus]|nr:hypothetical protein PM082_022168 [Marasmius tenuissimus]
MIPGCVDPISRKARMCALQNQLVKGVGCLQPIRFLRIHIYIHATILFTSTVPPSTSEANVRIHLVELVEHGILEIFKVAEKQHMRSKASVSTRQVSVAGVETVEHVYERVERLKSA